MPEIQLVNGFIEGILGVENRNIGIGEELMVVLDIVNLVDVELAVAGIDQHPPVILNPEPVRAAGLRHYLIKYPGAVEKEFIFSAEGEEFFRGLEVVKGDRKMGKNLLVIQPFFQIGERRVKIKPVSLDIKRYKKGYALDVIPMRVR